MWGLGNVLQLGCVPTEDNTTFNGMKPCDPAQWQLLQGWWSDFHDLITPILERNPLMGAWVASCFVHEINVDCALRPAVWDRLPAVRPSVAGRAEEERGGAGGRVCRMHVPHSRGGLGSVRLFSHPHPPLRADCSGQSLPNCRGWKTYTVAPPDGSAPQTLSEAFPAWFAATLADWDRVSASFRALAERAPLDVAAWRAAGALPGGPWAVAGGNPALTLSPHQLLDQLTYPMNPSCHYPPG